MKETETHIYFWGTIYSQWHKCSFSNGKAVFKSAEQWMMWSKAKLFNDEETAKKILAETDPKVQKSLGRIVKGFNQDIWDKNKFEIVVQGNLLKFSQNEELKQELLKSDKILVEGSPVDRIWGVGLKWDDNRILDQQNWRGQNLLGEALMLVRKKMKEESV